MVTKQEMLDMMILLYSSLNYPVSLLPHLLGSLSFTCSITSGAIQQGVPTNVCLTASRVMSLPVASHALTPKSAESTSILTQRTTHFY